MRDAETEPELPLLAVSLRSSSTMFTETPTAAAARLTRPATVDVVDLLAAAKANPVVSMYAAGIDCITLGNHAWDQREIIGYIDGDPKLLRPANYPPPSPGSGLLVCRQRVPVPVAVWHGGIS